MNGTRENWPDDIKDEGRSGTIEPSMTGGKINCCDPTPRVLSSEVTSVLRSAARRQPKVFVGDAPEHSGVALTNVCHDVSRIVAL